MDILGMRKSGASSKRRSRVGMLAVGLSFIAALSSLPAQADEANAKTLLKAMSEYLASQKNLSFEYDSSLEVITKAQQKLAIASSGTVNLSRPDRLRVTRTGGFADVEMLFDGKTVSILGKHANVYGQAEIPGTIDNLVDQLRDKYNRPVPGADLLLSNVYDQLMPLVTDVKDLGSGVIRGVECNHLAFRTPDVDWQIWIAIGEQPYPCRYVVTTTKLAGFPEYSLDVRNWKAGSALGSDDFTFKPPVDAKKLDFNQLVDTDELPSAYSNRGE